MHHGAGLRKLTGDATLAQALARDHRGAAISDADRAMLDFAVELTLRPWDMRRDCIERLRRAGFDDRAILDITQVTAYFAFVNRMADGLGVELETVHDGAP